MSTALDNLWPQININTLSPKTILTKQVENFRKASQGVLDAALSTVTGTDDYIIYHLDILSNDSRFRILTATRRKNFYPIVIEADCFRPKKRNSELGSLISDIVLQTKVSMSDSWPPEADWRKIAWDQEQFVKAIQEVLNSGEVRSIIESLIAQRNESDIPEAATA
jgi:hypothetical protein